VRKDHEEEEDGTSFPGLTDAPVQRSLAHALDVSIPILKTDFGQGIEKAEIILNENPGISEANDGGRMMMANRGRRSLPLRQMTQSIRYFRLLSRSRQSFLIG
jgi:hypothetical protein